MLDPPWWEARRNSDERGRHELRQRTLPRPPSPLNAKDVYGPRYILFSRALQNISVITYSGSLTPRRHDSAKQNQCGHYRVLIYHKPFYVAGSEDQCQSYAPKASEELGKFVAPNPTRLFHALKIGLGSFMQQNFREKAERNLPRDTKSPDARLHRAVMCRLYLTGLLSLRRDPERVARARECRIVMSLFKRETRHAQIFP